MVETVSKFDIILSIDCFALFEVIDENYAVNIPKYGSQDLLADKVASAFFAQIRFGKPTIWIFL